MLQRMRTTAQRLADIIIGRPIEDYLAERRATKTSWRRISLELRDEYDIDIAPMTLSMWDASAKSDAA